ncbi:MAG: hypothetical protein AAF959_19710 [Cyanobacteria bacterium P01_D01_bin.56]
MVHIRFESRFYNVATAQLEVIHGMGDDVVKERVARYLEVQPTRLRTYVVDHRPKSAIIVHPEAIYG